MKPAARDAEMGRFRDGELDVLVGTTVVEVGVDVPAATMMIIQGADRFGLAQLHQLRGRVGRGRVESFCVLVSDSDDEVAQARLKAVAELRDGFELAERDFELRREGDVLGLVQSGLPAAPRRLAPGPGPSRAGRPGAAVTPSRCSTPRGSSTRRGQPSPRSSRRAGSGGSRPANRRVAHDRMADAGRVIAGSARGIRLQAPGPGTRPLGDRVKQTLFAILEPDLRGARVLDLFAGSGAAGIEALSRGAAAAVFVERDPRAVAVIAANLRAVGVADRTSGHRRARRRRGLAWAARPTSTCPSTSSSSIRRMPTSSCAIACSRCARRAGRAVDAAGARVVAKHFWRDQPPAQGRAASIRACASLR